MAARVYNGVCLSDEQLDSLAPLGITPDQVTDTSCLSANENSCGKNQSEILSIYGLYDPGRVSPSPYLEGDRVVVIIDDGSILVVYEALEDLPTPPGPFDETHWVEICKVKGGANQSNLPSIESLESQYDYWDAEETPYGFGSTVLKYSPCGDATCVYVSSTSTSHSPPSSDWSRLYCVKNGRPSLCLKSEKCLGKVVYLSAPYSDQICVPVESTTGQRSD